VKQSKTDSGGVQKTTQIVIYIDTIDDIFSDFDPRTIDVRIISADFINEMVLQGRQSKKKSKIDVKILAPRAIKDRELTPRVEKTIRQRIRQFFDDEYRRLRSARRKNIIKALIFLISGLTCFFIVKLAGDPAEKNLAVKLSLELITFFSWFATWNGIDSFTDLPKIRDVRLQRSLADAHVHFRCVKDNAALNPE